MFNSANPWISRRWSDRSDGESLCVQQPQRMQARHRSIDDERTNKRRTDGQTDRRIAPLNPSRRHPLNSQPSQPSGRRLELRGSILISKSVRNVTILRDRRTHHLLSIDSILVEVPPVCQ